MAVRKLVAGGAITTVVTGILTGLTAAPAAASSGDITSPSDHAVVTQGSSVRIFADLDLVEQAKLRLRGPADESFHTVDEGQGELEYNLDISCPDYAGPCSGREPAPNGTYTVQVVQTGLLLSGGVDDRQTFTLRVPPRRPSAVSIRVEDADSVRIRWDRGAEPDITGYVVVDASGSKVQRVSAAEGCDDGSCATVVQVPASRKGERVAYTVRARRSVEPGSDATVASAPSDQVAVAVPPASPSPTSRIMGEAADAAAEATSEAEPSAAARPDGAQATLPHVEPLAAHSRLPLLEITALRNGEFRQGPGYPLPLLPSPTPRAGGQADALSAPALDSGQDTAPPRSMTSAIGMAPSEWWKTVALGLVLLLVAAHLGAWTWRTRPVPPHINPKKDRMRAAKASATELAARTGTDAGASAHGSGAVSTQRGRRRRPRRPRRRD